jgi:hypothetical protein
MANTAAMIFMKELYEVVVYLILEQINAHGLIRVPVEAVKITYGFIQQFNQNFSASVTSTTR